MKRYTLLTATVLLVATVFTTACDEGLAEINENPNAPTDAPAQYILPQAVQSSVEQIYYNWFNLEFTGLFAQHYAKVQYVEEDQWELRAAVIRIFWNNLYANDLQDWQTIEEKGAETGFTNHEATALTMKSYLYQVMTDIWGDIPYSEALQGDAEEANNTPVYDSQQSIYTGMVADLDNALSLFDASGRSWGAEDLIYGGDVAAWARFANSLKLRMAMRISDVDPTTAQTWAEEAVAHSAGLITTNAQNAQLTYLDASPNQNPMFENAKSRDDHSVSATLVNMLGSLNDPRIQVYAEPVPDPTVMTGSSVTVFGNEYRGQPNGVPEDEVYPLPAVSRIGDYWRDVSNSANATTPAWLLTAAEVHFLLAEAALNGWNTPMSAQQHYEAGIAASFEQFNGADGVTLDAAALATYMAQPGVTWGSGDSDLEQIIEQKWIALFTTGWEAYAEYRRTGFPDELQVNAGHILDHVPGRIPYPDVEQSLNAENWQAALQAQGIDGTYTGKTWWEPTLNDNN